MPPRFLKDRAALAAEGAAELRSARTDEGVRPHGDRADAKLTVQPPSDRMIEFGRAVSAWLSGQSLSGVPVSKGRGRAETSLLDLVRTGIENDFEQVVFPKYPELREVKSVLERAGAFYASLSGSGSALYGLFASRTAGQKAAVRLQRDGVPAVVTTTLTRRQYWKKISRFRFLDSRLVICGSNPGFTLQTETRKSALNTGPSTNGRSSAFGALCLGSNPSGPARKPALSH